MTVNPEDMDRLASKRWKDRSMPQQSIQFSLNIELHIVY